MTTWVKFLNSGLSTDDDTPGLTRRTLHSAAASFPQPTAIGGGGVVSTWRDDQGFGPDLANIEMIGSVACTLTGPVALYAERRGIVYFVGLLNYGSDIYIQSATVGWSQVIAGVGGAERLLVGGLAATVTPSAGVVTVKATPVATKEVD